MVGLNTSSVITLGVVLWLLGMTFGCKQPVMVTQAPKPEARVTKIELPPLVMPVDSNNKIYDGVRNPQAVYRFYKDHHQEPVWLKDSVPSVADSMVCFVRNARFNGLLPQDYHNVEFSTLVGVPRDTTLRYRKEVLLTDAFLSMASDLKYGRLNAKVSRDVIDSLGRHLLEMAIFEKEIRSVLESQEPHHPLYQQMKGSLYEILTSADSADRRVLLSGVTYDSVELHRTIQCVEVNMERWRSELNDFGERYVWINIPAYQLQVVERGRIVLESRVIVGQPITPTPTLNSVIKSISFYPYWHVPRKIAIEELLPSIQRDLSYLQRNNLDVLDRNGVVLNPATLEWKKFNEDYFPFSLRQREGSSNSLGIIKFVFDNPYAVFLHDTNAKGLFRTKYRALSHGCIRMEKPGELARYLVQEQDRVDNLIKRKLQTTISIPRPIPIYVRYLTCEVIDEKLICYNDIYGLDQAMIKLLYTRDRAHASQL